VTLALTVTRAVYPANPANPANPAIVKSVLIALSSSFNQLSST
jgi:Na+-translocating ferredoxin:NAD+ oxidoreductase RnfD subunit